METSKKIIYVLVAVAVVLLIVSKVANKNESPVPVNPDSNSVIDPVCELTGWTKEQFVEWAYEVQPIKEHKKWKQYRDKEPNEMDPNEGYACVIMNDANDVPFAPMYWEECYFELPSPYEDLPEPVRKVLECFDQNDVGKTIGEVLPEIVKPVLLCYFRNDKLANSEPLSVRLLSLSDDKLRFRVAHEPFSVSEVEGIEAEDRVILYTERAPSDKTKIGTRIREEGGEL